mmetsp:Transcript_6870/g.20404  ORF Transcript_6870/g.20404 Transcript_6870/m.20404 type:complete len:876 (-) Transcript_6870:616-3243(-)
MHSGTGHGTPASALEAVSAAPLLVHAGPCGERLLELLHRLDRVEAHDAVGRRRQLEMWREDLEGRLAPHARSARQSRVPEGGQLRLRQRAHRLGVALIAVKIVLLQRRHLVPVAGRLLPQLLVHLELPLHQRLAVVCKVDLGEVAQQRGHRLEESLDPLVEGGWRGDRGLDDEAEADRVVGEARGAPHDVAELLDRAQLLLGALVQHLLEHLDEHRAGPLVDPGLQEDLNRRVGLVGVGEQPLVLGQRGGVLPHPHLAVRGQHERAVHRLALAPLVAAQRLGADGGPGGGDHLAGLLGRGVAVAEGEHARRGEQLSRHEGSVLVQVERAALHHLAVVVEDVVAPHLEQDRGEVDGVLVRRLLEEVRVAAPHVVALYGEPLRGQVGRRELGDDSLQQRGQLVRVPAEEDREAAVARLDPVVQPGHLGVVGELGQLVRQLPREERRHHHLERRRVRLRELQRHPHVRLWAAERGVRLVPQLNASLIQQPRRQPGQRLRPARRAVTHQPKVGRYERIRVRQPQHPPLGARRRPALESLVRDVRGAEGCVVPRLAVRRRRRHAAGGVEGDDARWREQGEHRLDGGRVKLLVQVRRREHVRGRVVLERGCERVCGVHRLVLLLVPEPHLGERGALLKHPPRRRQGAEHVDGGEELEQNLVHLAVPLLRQGHLHLEHRKVGGGDGLAGAERVDPAAPLEEREERPLALVPEEVRDVPVRLGAPQLPDRRHRPQDRQQAQLPDRNVDERAPHGRGIWLARPGGRRAVDVWDGVEERQHELLELGEGLLADHAEPHRVGRVVPLVEGEERVADGQRRPAARHEPRAHRAAAGSRGAAGSWPQVERHWTRGEVTQRLRVACPELVLRVLRARSPASELREPPGV